MKRSLTIATDTKVIKTNKPVERTPFVLWAVILFMFVSIGRIQEIIPGLEKLYLGKVFGILMLGTYFFTSKRNRVSFKQFPELACVFGILVLSVLSIPFSVWPSNSAQAAMNYFLKNCLFLYIIANTLTGYKQIRKIVFALLAATALLSAAALSGQESTWRISAGGTYDANDLAFLLICVFPFAAFGFFEEKGIKKALLLVDLGLIIATIVFTRSRGGFLGLILVGGLIMLKTLRKRKLMAGLLLAGSIGVLVLISPSGYWERMSTIFEPGDDYNISSPAGRVEVWKRGLKMMIENPLTGVGIGNFATAEGLSHKAVGGKWSTAHNSFIEIGGELGVGGLILFVLLLYYLLKRLKRVKYNNPNVSSIKNSLETSILAYIIVGFFLSQAYNMVLYMLIGMTISLTCIVKTMEGERGKPALEGNRNPSFKRPRMGS